MKLRSPLNDLQPGFNFRNTFQYNFKFDLPFIPQIELGEVTYGLCGGLCFGTLDFYFADIPIPDMKIVPPDGSPLWRFLWKRQFDSLIFPIVPVRVFLWMLLNDRKVAKKTLDKEIPYLIERMRENKPVVLGLIRNKGWKNPTKNHQVLVTQFREESTQIQIEVYDPNHPNRNPSPMIIINKPHADHDFSIEQSTGENLRGFFVIDYKPKLPPTE